MEMQKCSIPSDLVGEYSAACQIVSQYEELRTMGPVDPDKAAWAGQELYTKTLIERIALLTAALKSAWQEDEALDEDLILHALQIRSCAGCKVCRLRRFDSTQCASGGRKVLKSWATDGADEGDTRDEESLEDHQIQGLGAFRDVFDADGEQ